MPLTTVFAVLSIVALRRADPRLGPVMDAALAPNLAEALRKRVIALSSAATLPPVTPAASISWESTCSRRSSARPTKSYGN